MPKASSRRARILPLGAAGVLLALQSCLHRAPPSPPADFRVVSVDGDRAEVNFPGAHDLGDHVHIVIYSLRTPGKPVALAQVIETSARRPDHAMLEVRCHREPVETGQPVELVHPDRVPDIGKCLAEVVTRDGVPQIRTRLVDEGAVEASWLLINRGEIHGVKVGVDRFIVLGGRASSPGAITDLGPLRGLGSCVVEAYEGVDGGASWCRLTGPVAPGGLPAVLMLVWDGRDASG